MECVASNALALIRTAPFRLTTCKLPAKQRTSSAGPFSSERPSPPFTKAEWSLSGTQHIQCSQVSEQQPGELAGHLSLGLTAFHFQDQAQGGAQGMEDGAALGLVMQGVTDRTQIAGRLSVYEQIRHSRASSVQLLSSFGMDQTPHEGVRQYMEGSPIPSMSLGVSGRRETAH